MWPGMVGWFGFAELFGLLVDVCGLCFVLFSMLWVFFSFLGFFK